jgi:hypothetical protein
LEDFFTEYEARTNRALSATPDVDTEAIAQAFADCFIEASPNGINCGKNDEQFRAVIPQGFAFYRSIGTKSMRVDSLRITHLDDYHSMVKVYWDSRYTKKDGIEEAIEFNVIYFLQMIDTEPKIFAYITGDEQKAMQQRGLI